MLGSCWSCFWQLLAGVLFNHCSFKLLGHRFSTSLKQLLRHDSFRIPWLSVAFLCLKLPLSPPSCSVYRLRIYTLHASPQLSKWYGNLPVLHDVPQLQNAEQELSMKKRIQSNQILERRWSLSDKHFKDHPPFQPAPLSMSLDKNHRAFTLTIASDMMHDECITLQYAQMLCFLNWWFPHWPFMIGYTAKDI